MAIYPRFDSSSFALSHPLLNVCREDHLLVVSHSTMLIGDGRPCGKITTIYACLVVLTTFACAMKFISPFQLYFSLPHILDGQIWRIFTHLLFLSPDFSAEFFLHTLFWVQYSNDLETATFRNRPADFLWMLLFGSAIVTVCSFI